MIYILLTWLFAPIWWPIVQLRKLGVSAPRRILIAEIAGIGDVVCSASLFQALRDRYPHATIDLLVDPIARGLKPLLPMVDRVRVFAYAEQKGLKGRLKLARIATGYDTAICLIPSAAQLTGFCWGAVPRRMSVLPGNLNPSYRLLAPLITTACRHQDGYYFPGTQFELCAALLPNDRARQKRLVVPAGAPAISLPSNIQWIGLLISSGRALKRLSETQLVALAMGVLNLANNTGIVLLGGPGDRDQAQAVMALLGTPQGSDAVINTVGQYELAQLPGILESLSLFIGVDSGVTHMADAVGVPVVCISGPVDYKEVYLPGKYRQVLCASELDCYPCSTVFNTPDKCLRCDRACLEQLSVNSVLAAASSLLEPNDAL